MLMRLGVTITATDTFVPTMGMIPDPDLPGFGLPLHVARYTVNAVERVPREIWVDAGGRRFVDESTRSPFEREQALMGIDGLRMVAIWDQKAFESSPPVIGPDWTRARMEEAARDDRWLHRRDTLEQLADVLRVDPDGLVGTVEAWNVGEDPYGRTDRPPVCTPPFWGVAVVGGMLLSRGGPRVDGRLRPLVHGREPLHGVSCVGELLGMGQFSGDNFAGGMSVGPALSLGRWVVRMLASGS
jgi:hypothetical protein